MSARISSRIWENLHRANILRIPFDASMTVHSVYSESWSSEENKERGSLIRRLNNTGLRKVFLGVESGSLSQLSRYCKGYKPSEAATACRVVTDNGITLEIGFIMFDPLCTISEIEENVRFLQDNDLASATSSLGSGLELRLQHGSRYLDLLDVTQEKLGVKLFDRQLDINTLTYPSFYLKEDVSKVVAILRSWNALLRPIYYPLKSLSRYGTGGMLQEQAQDIRIILAQTRYTYLQRISEAITAVKSGGDMPDRVNELFNKDLQYLAENILRLFRYVPDQVLLDPVFASMFTAVKRQAGIT